MMKKIVINVILCVMTLGLVFSSCSSKAPEKQQNIALETMEIYAPLAERVGLQRIKNELQDLSFQQQES